MNMQLLDKDLTKFEWQEIENLLKRQNKNITDDLEQMWYLIDLVWDDLGCNNKKLDWRKIKAFYSHPVWLLNGLFIEQHEISMAHRHAISNWIFENKFRKVIDYGGGFGTLARLIAKKDIRIDVYIYEPYPSKFAIKKIKEYPNITFINELSSDYDCLICIDVLEHVPYPLEVFKQMIESVKIDGYLVISNCFYPVIKCHLPCTFHLRYTFNTFAKMMGLEVIGLLEGSPATIFKKITDKQIDMLKVKRFEKLSRIFFPIIETLKPILRPIKRLISK